MPKQTITEQPFFAFLAPCLYCAGGLIHIPRKAPDRCVRLDDAMCLGCGQRYQVAVQCVEKFVAEQEHAERCKNTILRTVQRRARTSKTAGTSPSPTNNGSK